MDIKIWEKTITTWLNSLTGSSHITSIDEISENILMNVIKKINPDYGNKPLEFLKGVFPNLTDKHVLTLTSNIDYLCASTLLLIYVSLSKNVELEEIRNLMCTKLDITTQLSVVEFLKHIQEYEDIFGLSFKKIKQELFPQIFSNFIERNCKNKSAVANNTSTPVKSDATNNSFDSPLQGFFQTPKRSNTDKQRPYSLNICGDGDHVKRIKKLSSQLAEEELEKTSLQEKLEIQTQKCIEYELKLKLKIEEINNLKEEWEHDSKRNEDEITSLRNTIKTKLDYEKKLKSELLSLENYVSTLESDLSNSASKNARLEKQLQEFIERFTLTELQLKETADQCIKLQNAIDEKERELNNFREQYTAFFNDEKSIDVSFANKSLDKSSYSPENLGIVVDKLLREKIEENTTLQETIEELRAEKRSLVHQINSLNEQLTCKSSVISELQFLKKELNAKIENFEKTEKELFKTQKELFQANAEINKLNKENFHAVEKYNILNSRLQEREQVLINCKNSKALLEINILKLVEDFKAVQQRLELEVKNISRLVLYKEEKISELEEDWNSTVVLKKAEITNDLSMDNVNTGPFDKNSSDTKNELVATFNSVFSPSFSNEKLCKLADMIQNFEIEIEWSKSKASLQKTCSELNENVFVLKLKVHEIEEIQKNIIEKKRKLEKLLKETEEKLSKVQSENSSEITRMRNELEEKENKIKELENLNLHKDMQNKMSLNAEFFHKDKKVLFREKNFENILEKGDHKSIYTVTVSNTAPENLDDGGKQEFSDSLEEVPMNNKTFDIVNLEEKFNKNQTFSIKKETDKSMNKGVRGDSAWTISPPSKVPVKIQSTNSVKNHPSRRVQGETWVVPLKTLKSQDSKMKKICSSASDLRIKNEDTRISELQKEIIEFSKECDHLRATLYELEQKRKKDKENFEKNQEVIRQNITAKYENQLEHLKNEMKQLYNRELAKHKQEQASLNSELREQNKRYKEHIDELRNQLWDLREKLLQEQTMKRELERNFTELKLKYENVFSKDSDTKLSYDISRLKESEGDNLPILSARHLPNITFPTIPTEDEEEVFDNRFLEDMKTGVCKTERPEDRLRELQYRNSLCLPHLKSSYPGETQFHNPSIFKEIDLKFGNMHFGQESQSLTDSDHSMTKSLLPDNKGKKKDQTSYKRPGPPTPSKHGGRLSIQSGDLRLTPRNVLKEINDANERNKNTPNPLKLLLSSKNTKSGSIGVKDENTAPVTPRKKKFFRKPFGARDH